MYGELSIILQTASCCHIEQARLTNIFLLSSQEPSIQQMAQQIAQDPAFAQMTAALQAQMVDGEGAPEAGVAQREPTHPAGDMPAMDPEKYAAALSDVLQNQQFMEMAEKLGQQIMAVSCSYAHTSFLKAMP